MKRTLGLKPYLDSYSSSFIKMTFSKSLNNSELSLPNLLNGKDSKFIVAVLWDGLPVKMLDERWLLKTNERKLLLFSLPRLHIESSHQNILQYDFYFIISPSSRVCQQISSVHHFIPVVLDEDNLLPYICGTWKFVEAF